MTNPNPFELMIADKPYMDVLKAAATIPKAELYAVIANFHDQQIADIGTYTSTTCRGLGVQHTLVMGGFLHLFAIAVDTNDRRELFENLLKDVEISSTQAYRAIAVWRHFGAKLLAEPSLTKHLVVEALKILSKPNAPEAARQEALQLARQEERVSIKLAEKLVRKHGGEAESKSRKAKTTAGKRNWLFAGDFIRIQLLPKFTPDEMDVAALIRDLEAALTELRRQPTPMHLIDSATA